MARTEAKRAGRRFYRRPACLVALGLTASLGAAVTVAAVMVSARHSTDVAAQPLSIRAEPSSQTVAPGASAHFAVRVTGRHVGQVGLGGGTTLSVGRELPAGAGTSFTQRELASSAPHLPTTLTIATTVDTPPGTYLLHVRARRPHRSGATAISLIVSGRTTSGRASALPLATPDPPVTVPDAFTIAGALADPLTPGTGAPLDLTLANQEGTDLSISVLSVQVASVSGPHADATHPCSANDFSVEQFSGASGFTLPASSTFSLSELGFAPAEWPQVSMLNLLANQDGCKQASLTLAFAGTATEEAP
jgi:hypothetical protein